MIQNVKVTLTSATLKTGGGFLVDLLPAPAAGHVFNILALTANMTYNSAAYAGGYLQVSQQNRFWNGGVFSQSDVLTNVHDYSAPFVKITGGQTIYTITDKLQIRPSGALTVGDSDIDIHIAYEDITL